LNTQKVPSFWQALLCFGGVLTIIVMGVIKFGVNIHVLLILSIVWTCFHAYSLGYKFKAIKKLMSDGISNGLGAAYVFILIGIVVASFLESGTIASIVYYSLDLIHPAVFLPAGLLLCSFMSVSVGTLMGTVATAGVILIGIGEAMGVPLPIVAGMVIAGASFGDKMSPVSDTTNLAAISAGTDLYTHIKSMMYTTIPTYLICLVIFTFIGLQYSADALATNDIKVFQQAISDNYVVSIWGFVPVIVLFGLSLNKFAAEPAMIAASVVAIIMAVFQQGHDILVILGSLQDGYKAETGHPGLDTLVNRGGIQSMMRTFSLALFAMALGGLLDKVGILTAMLEGILVYIKSVVSLLFATMLTGIISSIATGQSYISIVLTSQLFKKKYEEMGLKRRMLSRTVEESTTLITPLMPWSLGGAFYSAVMGVAVIDYMPWAFLNYLNFIVALVIASLGFAIFRKEEETE
jgi:Na+:H+ antiporter, NhaC family